LSDWEAWPTLRLAEIPAARNLLKRISTTESCLWIESLVKMVLKSLLSLE
jgi:hypothetical protein